MTDTKTSADTLLTEHFRYTPLSLIDDIINTVNAIIYRAIQAIENGLLSTPPSNLGFDLSSQDPSNFSIRDTNADGEVEYPEARTEIENGVHELETLLEATVDKTFDLFEIYTLRNILCVPEEVVDWIRLGHYEGLNLPLPAESPNPSTILAIHTRLREAQKVNRILRSHQVRNATLISSLQSLLSSPSSTDGPNQTSATNLSFLTSSTTNPNPSSKDLTTNAQFSTSQLPALRALLADLRPKLKSLPEQGQRVDPDSKREVRRRYVDGVVERVVQDQGMGEDEIVGTRVGPDEVASLEEILGMRRREE